MRAILVLLVISSMATEAAAASLVRMSWSGDSYRVAFESTSPETPTVRWTAHDGSGEVVASRAPSVPSDTDIVYVAEIPAKALGYSVNGRNFLTQPVPGPNEPVRIVFLADMGRGQDAKAVWAAVAATEPSLVIVGGDISYSNGRSEKWDEWFRLAEPLAARIPVMTAFGNHESYCTDPGDLSTEACASETLEYSEHFHMPNAPHRFYDFRWGPAHLVALDTEAYQRAPKGAPWTDAKEQLAFLQTSLAQRPEAWNIVYAHRPLYTTNAHAPEGAGDAARAALLPVLDGRSVDLVLAGHAHAYERSWPLRNGSPTSSEASVTRGTGTFYVTSGGGGRSLYDEWGPTETWSVKRTARFHFLVIDISPDQLELRAVTPSFEVFDEVTIRREGASALLPPTLQSHPIATPPAAMGAAGTPAPGLLALLVVTFAAVALRRVRR